MQVTFRCEKKVTPDAVRVDDVTGEKIPLGGRYNRPKLDADGSQVFKADANGVPQPVVEQGTFVAVEFKGCNDDDPCHERTAHCSMFFNDLTEAAGAEFEAGKEYLVTIVEKK